MALAENEKMKVYRVSADEYSARFKNGTVFQTTSFNEINRKKVDDMQYLLIKKGESVRFALVVGITDGHAKCPFSSPCGYPVSVKDGMGVKDYDSAADAIEEYAGISNWRDLRFILPPIFYDNSELVAWMNALYRKGFMIEQIDINYAFDLKKVYCSDYETIIHHNARKNLRIALAADLSLFKCENETDLENAYEIIRANRESRGFPLRMSCEQVLQTVKMVPHDAFIVKSNEEGVAAALIYRVTSDICQVIYWGDKPGFANLKPINYLSYQLLQYYGEQGIRYLDIGISTAESEPNYGLCDFKESIGCERDLKITFVKRWDD